MKHLWKIFFVISISSVEVFGVDQLLEELVYGSQKFTADVYQELVKTLHGNFVFSPFPTFLLLALLKGSALNKTEQEFQQALFLPDTSVKVEEAVLELFGCKEKPCNKLDSIIVNKIYMADRFEFDKEFQNVARTIYRTGYEKMNFSDNIRAAEHINSWVRDHTQHKIRNLVDPNDIDSRTKMALVNALSFFGNWKLQFLKTKSSPHPFFSLTSNVLEVEMMKSIQRVKFFHCPVVKAKYVLLDFENENYYLEIVLPDYPLEDFAVLERRLERILKHTEFYDSKVTVMIPRFSTTTEIDFIEILRNLGIKRIFEPNQADLTGISVDPDLHVDNFLQQTSIDVKEEGVFSDSSMFPSAATVWSALTSYYTQLKFKADHPFFYCLKEKSGIVLLAGRFVSPRGTDPLEMNVQ